ncbi:MAG: hypothetical protein R3313_03120 [Candidatus Saccharimonadales bacterium]|nr:hypothetical protein [Candidatus Saccharimonadales bacterium]
MAWLLVGSRAAGPFASLEPEDGSVTAPSSVISDAQTSSGAFVNFSSTSGDSGIPIGFWGMNGYWSVDGFRDVASRFKVTVSQLSSSDPSYGVNTLLPMAREAGMKLTLRMTGGHSHYTTNNNFDIDKWKAKLAVWENSGVQEFIDDGTLAGHMVLDDISNWSGQDPTGDDLDEMARYSKQIMPGLMTYVRKDATKLPVPSLGVYQHLDAVGNQYTEYRGEINSWAAAQVSKANDLNLGSMFGLGIAYGGDGSSGQVGWAEGQYAMSADEIRNYGQVLLDIPENGMFLSWEYDANEQWIDGTTSAEYFDQPELQAALVYIGELAAQHPLVQLLKN